MLWTAQIKISTRFVQAVVMMAPPRAEPPPGIEFVDVEDDSMCGKYYVNGQFQDNKPESTQP